MVVVLNPNPDSILGSLRGGAKQRGVGGSWLGYQASRGRLFGGSSCYTAVDDMLTMDWRNA